MQGDLTLSKAGEIEKRAGITVKETLYAHRIDYMCMFTPSQAYTRVPHGDKHFQYVLLWGGEVGLENHKRASFCPLRNTYCLLACVCVLETQSVPPSCITPSTVMLHICC